MLAAQNPPLRPEPFGDSLALQQHDRPAGILLDGLQRGPQAGEATADDDEVGLGVADQPGTRGRSLRTVEPVRSGDGVSEALSRPHGWTDAGSEVSRCA